MKALFLLAIASLISLSARAELDIDCFVPDKIDEIPSVRFTGDLTTLYAGIYIPVAPNEGIASVRQCHQDPLAPQNIFVCSFRTDQRRGYPINGHTFHVNLTDPARPSARVESWKATFRWTLLGPTSERSADDPIQLHCESRPVKK